MFAFSTAARYLTMVWLVVWGLVLKIFPQLSPERLVPAVGHVVLKTPTSVLVPVVKVAETLARCLKWVPVFKNIEFTRLPFISKYFAIRPTWTARLTRPTGPILMGVQSILALKATTDAAKQKVDQFAGNMVSLTKVVPLDSAATATGQHLLDMQSATLSGVSTGASYLGATAKALGNKIGNAKDTPDQVVTNRAIPSLGGFL
ncbi:hypothetical protein PG994_014631 [Apiospora phragmitis]|uniref:Uncharacterized protein n=1 Tax=Apiospora phragmitis TaxID=2905665 RepID=A0ABR1T4X1_9PEZI